MAGLDHYLETAKELVYFAGRMAREKFYEGVVEVQTKADKSWVTDLDVKIEERVKERLRQLFPQHAFWGEELGESRGEWRWVLDPIDGTTNFASHVPFFNISLALEHGGRPVLGVVYNPILDEMFYAAKGMGSFVNGKKLHVNAQLRGMYGFCYAKGPFAELAGELIKMVEREGEHIRKWGSAALELSYIALGAFDGFVGLGLKLGDFKAAQVVVEEAGGVVYEKAGKEGPTIVAGKTQEVVEKLEERLRRLGI